ncbi:hypothetical protein IGI49_004911 [Enterococcus sp. AZ071]
MGEVMKKIFYYLSELQQNNDREWFHAHKPERLAALQMFEQLVHELNAELMKMDATISLHEPKNLTYRLNRDIRFAKDKTPYMPAFRANIAPNGKDFIPVGYYLFLMPGDRSFLGGGFYADGMSEVTNAIRTRIIRKPEEFLSIINQPEFARTFEVLGTKLKRIPRGFEEYKDSELAEWLKHKSWHLSYNLTDEVLLSSQDFVGEAVKIFRLMKPFNHFINGAL